MHIAFLLISYLKPNKFYQDLYHLLPNFSLRMLTAFPFTEGHYFYFVSCFLILAVFSSFSPLTFVNKSPIMFCFCHT